MLNNGTDEPTVDREAIKDMIAGRIREARQKRGMSQAVLADRCGVSKSAILRWEQGTNLTPLHQLMKVAEALGPDLSFFLQDLSDCIQLAENLDEQWLPAAEQGDRAEMAVRLKDLVEAAQDVTIYVGASQPTPVQTHRAISPDKT